MGLCGAKMCMSGTYSTKAQCIINSCFALKFSTTGDNMRNKRGPRSMKTVFVDSFFLKDKKVFYTLNFRYDQIP